MHQFLQKYLPVKFSLIIVNKIFNIQFCSKTNFCHIRFIILSKLSQILSLKVIDQLLKLGACIPFKLNKRLKCHDILCLVLQSEKFRINSIIC